MSAQAIEVELPPLHSGQQVIEDRPARFKWLACGRRFGKSTYSVDKCVECAAPGGRAWYVVPSYKSPSAIVAWRELRNVARQIPGTDVNKADHRITFPSNGEVWLRSAMDPDDLRGEGLDLVVMDECAIIQQRAWDECLSPALMDRKGSALFISTPRGRTWFWREWHAASEDTSGESAAFRFTTFDNPLIPQSEKDRIQTAWKEGRIADRTYRQEWLAEFIDDTGGIFRAVVESATAKEQEKAIDGHDYVIGADWGKINDPNVFVVFDATLSALVYIDHTTQIDYTVQAARLEALASKFKPLEIVAESNSMGEAVIEQLRQRDLPVRGFTTTNASKKNAVDEFSLAIENGTATIVPDEGLIAELQAFEGTRLPGGGIRYAAPAGMHDDRVMASAIGWTGVSDGGMGCLLL